MAAAAAASPHQFASAAAAMAAPGPAVGFTPTAYTPEEVFAALESELLLLIDARPYSEYLVSHISGALSVRLSSLMTRRLSKGSNKLFDLVIQEQKPRYRELFERPGSRIVVYDSGTPGPLSDYDGKNPLHVILKSLYNAGDKECGFLAGGFEAFREQFPNAVVVPDVIVNAGMPAFPMIGALEEPLSAALLSAGAAPPAISPFGGESESARARKILNMAPSEIEPFLVIGSKRDAANWEVLSGLAVTHVINATPDCPCHFPHDLSYLRLAVRDCWNQNLPAHFESAFAFIEEAKRGGGKVMIHCTAGISRSAAIAIAYIMSAKRMALSDAYSYVKAKRPVISPNLDFMGELQQFERILGVDGASR